MMYYAELWLPVEDAPGPVYKIALRMWSLYAYLPWEEDRHLLEAVNEFRNWQIDPELPADAFEVPESGKYEESKPSSESQHH